MPHPIADAPPAVPPPPPTFDPERFLEKVTELQGNGAPPTLLVQLRAGGVEVSPPEVFAPEELERRLWDVLHALALLHVHLVHTDHLSDEELYRFLWTEVLPSEAVDVPDDADTVGWWTFDVVGSGSDDDIELYLRYYAGPEERAWWADDWPEMHMPAHEDPAYDRDSRLP